MRENCHENVENVENVGDVENVGNVENIENVMMTWKSSLCDSCLFVGSVLRRKMMKVTKMLEDRLRIGSVQCERIKS